MADATFQPYPDSTGKMFDLTSLTVAANTVHRQRFNLADPTGATAIASIVAKNSQGSFALAVSRLIDSGRGYWAFSWDAVAGVVSEALVTGVANLAGVNAGGATSYVVSSGKTLRLTSISVDLTGSAAGNVKLAIRSAPPTLVVGSPLIYRCQLGISAANAFDHKEHTFPEGFELAAGQAIGISQLASATTVNTTVTLNGYEY
jgi:hypothetical protein